MPDGLHAIDVGVYGAVPDLYDDASDAIFAAFTTPPTTARKGLIDACVVSLKSAGVWAKLDALYAFAAADSQAALINWVNPGTYNGTLVNAPTFTADLGFTGVETSYLDSGFNPTTAGSPKYVQDSACVFAYTPTAGAGVQRGIIGSWGGYGIALYPVYSDNNLYVRVNDSGANLIVANASMVGLYSGDRSSSTVTTIYKNGASLATGGGASDALDNQTTKFLIVGGAAGAWLGQISVGGFGQSLNSTEQTALYNALRTYLTGVGVP